VKSVLEGKVGEKNPLENRHVAKNENGKCTESMKRSLDQCERKQSVRTNIPEGPKKKREGRETIKKGEGKKPLKNHHPGTKTKTGQRHGGKKVGGGKAKDGRLAR